MDRGEVDRCRRSVREQAPYKCVIDPRRVGEVGIAGFEGEGMAKEPVFERYVEGGPQLRKLGGVDVQIDEAGKKNAPAAEVGRSLRNGSLQRGDREDGAGLVHIDERIGDVLDPAPFGGMKQR